MKLDRGNDSGGRLGDTGMDRGDPQEEQPEESCEVCGSTDLAYVHCKVICQNCLTILRTCSDL